MKRILSCCPPMLASPMLASLLLTPSLPAQPPGLQAEVEACLAAVDDADASRLLEQLLKAGPPPAELLAAVTATPGLPPGDEVEGSFPFDGERMQFVVQLPEGFREKPKKKGGEEKGEEKKKEAPRWPVMLDISGGHNFGHLGMERCLRVAVGRFDSAEFTDRRRDGYLKALRVAAHRCHGDPDRLWMTGYSWAAHAAWDIALHRPGVLRGLAGFGGGPRRVSFRLMANLEGTELRAYCGARDDPELVWNLREMQRVGKRQELGYHLVLDPEQGHNMPLAGYRELATHVDASTAAVGAGAAAWPEEGERRGELLADGPGVESPLLRIDAVVPARVSVPARIPVSARLSPDEQRRATLAAMQKSVAMVGWRWQRRGTSVQLHLRPRHVESLTVFLRPPMARVGDRVEVKVGSRVCFSGALEVDPRALLEEARRTGERIRPALARVRAEL